MWTGSISFGLVDVPVKAYTAVRDHDVHFRELDRRSGSRVRNRKVAEKSGREVDADDIGVGFGGAKAAAAEQPADAADGTVLDLMAALEASVNASKARRSSTTNATTARRRTSA
ncbi:MAG: Ku protein [Ilumatobacteraceae bacterium]